MFVYWNLLWKPLWGSVRLTLGSGSGAWLGSSTAGKEHVAQFSTEIKRHCCLLAFIMSSLKCNDLESDYLSQTGTPTHKCVPLMLAGAGAMSPCGNWSWVSQSVRSSSMTDHGLNFERRLKYDFEQRDVTRLIDNVMQYPQFQPKGYCHWKCSHITLWSSKRSSWNMI